MKTVDLIKLEIKKNIQVRPNDLDRLGHVNNAVILEYLEVGRWEWLQGIFLSLSGNDSILPVVTRSEINYRKEMNHKEYVVATKLNNIGSYSTWFDQSIHDLTNPEIIYADAKIQVGFIDSNSRTLASSEDFFHSEKLLKE